MAHVSIVARVTVKEGRANEYVAAFVPLLEQAVKQPGTLLYAVNRSKDDPHVFWTTEIYADGDAFAAHSASEVHAAAAKVFTELIAAADVTIGETVMAKGLSGLLGRKLRSRDFVMSGTARDRMPRPGACVSCHTTTPCRPLHVPYDHFSARNVRILWSQSTASRRLHI